MLRALVHHARGDVDRAVAVLDDALRRAPEPDSYVRLFLDEGEAMPALLHDAASRPEPDGQDVVRRHATRLLAAAEHERRLTEEAPPANGAQPLVDPLSDRELEVLRLLDSELTGPEIARRLFVSLNTLRTHTRHVFTKLEVTNRSGAVRRGRELGLL
jgi:LuxR family maltose regulon positive regulatory protein